MAVLTDGQIPVLDSSVLNFKTATKTKPIKAKHMQHLLCDEFVLSKFLLSTLEGNQMLKANSMVCVVEANDAWQQTSEKLFDKYTVTGVDETGWMIYEPKPDNEVWASEIDGIFFEFGPDEQFAVKAQWGERQSDGTFLLYGVKGDFVLKSKTDPTDVWIVKNGLFISTYDFK